MYNILTLNKISKIGLNKLDSSKYTCSDATENPDAILVRSASMHEMSLSENTVAIARAGAGVNNIPVDTFAEQGVVVFNTPGANANAVKELVICGLLLSSRKIAASIDWCKGLKGEGDGVSKAVEKGKSAFVGPEILGKTLGVVGMGAIGALVANSASALGMNILCFDSFKNDKKTDEFTAKGYKIASSMDEIYAKSDYITLHIPYNDSTKGMINSEAIAKMKDGVRLINFARGELVNSSDLIVALDSGKVAAYVTDFPTDEQIGHEGVTAIPHLGASTPESEDNCAVMAAEEISNYLEKGAIKNSVNYPNTQLADSFDVRTCILHKEDDTIPTKATAAATAQGAAIKGVFSAAKKGNGYTVIDTDREFDTSSIGGIIRVRIIK